MKGAEILKSGDEVLVYPHGDRASGAIGRIALLSENQLAIAVSFEEKPPFVRLAHGAFLGPGGITMLASRIQLNGKPWGPWVEALHGGHYEIEALEALEEV